jgi:hypothetical protein
MADCAFAAAAALAMGLVRGARCLVRVLLPGLSRSPLPAPGSSLAIICGNLAGSIEIIDQSQASIIHRVQAFLNEDPIETLNEQGRRRSERLRLDGSALSWLRTIGEFREAASRQEVDFDHRHPRLSDRFQ